MVCPLPLCAKANERRRPAERVDDAGLVTVITGRWAQHEKRVQCAGCGGFVRWAPKDRTPEELAARNALMHQCRREYYGAKNWNVKREDLPPVDWMATHDEYPPAAADVLRLADGVADGVDVGVDAILLDVLG
jgi:hypothetical protein